MSEKTMTLTEKLRYFGTIAGPSQEEWIQCLRLMNALHSGLNVVMCSRPEFAHIFAENALKRADEIAGFQKTTKTKKDQP